MEYLVNGKKFSNIEEARQYEDSLRKESSSESSKNNVSKAYKKYIRSKLQVFKVEDIRASKPKYIAVVADGKHLEYLYALLGTPFVIKNGELIKCWSCTQVTGDIVDNITDCFINGGGIVHVTSKAHFECCVDACEKRGENPYFVFTAKYVKSERDIAQDYIKTGEKFIELTNKSVTSAEELFDIFYRLGL